MENKPTHVTGQSANSLGSTKILIVEDDEELKNLLQKRLSEYGFLCDAVENGEQLIKKISEKTYDLVILDIMLPGEDGLSLCRKLRDTSQKNPGIPIIFTSALGEVTDRVVGLEMGADDYLPKPFIMRELVARIRSVLRRTGKSHSDYSILDDSKKNILKTITFDKWKLDLFSRCLMDEEGTVVSLSRMEFMLLNFLLRHPHQVLSREQIIDGIGNDDVYDRNVDVQINRLRNKLRDTDKKHVIIQTVRGMGYMLAVDIEKENI